MTTVTVLGMGAMGRALAGRFLAAGHRLTVWNRTPGKAAELVAQGAAEAADARQAVQAGDLVVVCLLDHGSVHDALDPIGDALAGRTVVNLTSTTPQQARELADWADGHGIAYLDGGIMAIPDMIGHPGAAVFYSGAATVFESYQDELGLLGAAEYFGADAGLASLYDFSLLAGMYLMFGGFAHGAAMAATGGLTATRFAELAEPFLRAMTGNFKWQAAAIDAGDYTTTVQDLGFTKLAVDAIDTAGREAGINGELFAVVKAVVDRQVAAGHGDQAMARIFEEFAERP